MMINESFYIAISFILLIIIIYPGMKNFLNQYLQNNILILIKKIDDAKTINLKTKDVLSDLETKLMDLLRVKNEKILSAKENAITIRNDYINHVNLVLDQKSKAFDLYILNIKSQSLKKARSKIIHSAALMVSEIIKHEPYNYN